MGSVQPAEWYDEYFKKKKKHYKNPPSSSTVYALYKESALWAIEQDLPVIDIGCGPGILYTELRASGFKGEYKGIDFSSAALEIAESRRVDGDNKVLFVNSDIERISFSHKRKSSFIICETLEHLEQDVWLLSRIPMGSPVWFSVPNFDVASHVRFFADSKEVLDRYDFLFSSLKMTHIPIMLDGKEFHRYFIGTGIR